MTKEAGIPFNTGVCVICHKTIWTRINLAEYRSVYNDRKPPPMRVTHTECADNIDWTALMAEFDV